MFTKPPVVAVVPSFKETVPSPTPETNPYMKKFLELSGWKPDKLGVFAGKIDYPKYGFFDKQIIRLIMLITKGPTDTSQTYEFTDWEKVREFSRQLL